MFVHYLDFEGQKFDGWNKSKEGIFKSPPQIGPILKSCLSSRGASPPKKKILLFLDKHRLVQDQVVCEIL